ncbi:hypothetical protein MGN70_000610 [Eutypa lata]|nr:hypothetical protein MGN70_000610 [Eutypa lata]
MEGVNSGEHSNASGSESEIPQKYDAIIAAADDTSGSLTVGFELEVLFPTLPSEQAYDPHLSEHGMIYKGMRQGEFGEDFPDDEEETFDDWLLNLLRRMMPDEQLRAERDDDLFAPHDNIPYYDAWRVIDDYSLAYKETRPLFTPYGYYWVGREITSEVLNADDRDTCAEKVTAICRALRQARVHLNDTTSVHVHVGRGDQTFSLLTVKKFTTLLWFTDAKILKLHHPSRQNNEFCRPVVVDSVLALKSYEELQGEEHNLDQGGLVQMREFLPEKAFEEALLAAQLRRIWGSKDVEDIARLLTCADRTGGRGSVGFSRFLPAGKTGGNLHTFKWRQMAGCLDPVSIMRWLRVCVGFTNFARLSLPVTFKTLILAFVLIGENFSGLDLIQALALDNEGVHFAKRLREYRLGEAELFQGESDGDLFLKPL